MTAQVVSFLRRTNGQAGDWSQRELAEFYRVEGALLQSGVLLETDRGLSDEGEPWFVFCRLETGEPFVHFARLSGEYIIDAPSMRRVFRGRDFSAIVRQVLEVLPLARLETARSENVFFHPSAILIALVGAILFSSDEARAADLSGQRAEDRRWLLSTKSLPVTAPGATGSLSVAGASPEVAAVILSALIVSQELSSRVPEHSTRPFSDLQPDVPVLLAFEHLDDGRGLAGGGERLEPATPSQIGWAMWREAPAGMSKTGLLAAPDASPLGAVPADPISAPILAQLEFSQDESVRLPIEKLDKPFFISQAVVELAPDTLAAAAALFASGSEMVEVLRAGVSLVDHVPDDLRSAIEDGRVVAVPPAANGAAPDPSPAAGEIASGMEPSPHPSAVAWTVTDELFADLIGRFVAQVGDLDVIREHQRLVLYDEDIFSPFSSHMNLASVTFTFADGSSVSLVGATSDLTELGWLGH